MYGIFGRYLDIDLSVGAIREYKIPTRWQELHLGGRGIAARVLLKELSGKEDPLSPESILIFATGPFQGTELLGAGRHLVMGISPKTGSVCGSYVGGYFGHELGRSGYDGILLRGTAAEPVYLTLIDGVAQIHPATDLWGKGTGKTETALKERHPGGCVASIGIAGEKLVQMACIIHDRSRAAGRPGLGAVMGSKRLKAILVQGNEEKPLYDRERFKKERALYAKLVLDDEMKHFGKYGTAAGVTWLSEMGILPTRNFQEGVFDHAESIGGEKLHDTILVGREGCTGCPIRCKRVVRTSFAKREVLPEFGGPEYETIAAFGSLCLNDNLDAICLANQLCNDYGIDTISAGVAIAFLMEASEKGLIDEEIPWGDGEAIVSLIDQIAHREGIGDRIADGLEAFADELGSDFHMTIKGMEIPMHEPRGKQGLGISYATSPRGATHLEGMHDTMLTAPTSELGIDHAYDRFTLADKPGVAKTYEDLRSFENSLILCVFTVRETGEHYSFSQIRSLLEAATGIGLSPIKMLEIGERNYALLRLHAARAGHTMDGDRLPMRFSQPLLSGASADHPIRAEAMRTAIEVYYQERGYDQLGPTDETLGKLGLEDCIGVIER
ncbi:TPA: aldehyde ferredoxin oxidoreductase [Candidatus Acetothermia bacterium]|nr:aldehyde ferredoxin oxidoreductase [Candidatus Acetothermia bacterium]